jgi:long-chain acyl-CoA synthetase
MKRTIATMFQDMASRAADRPALLHKQNGAYVPLTWRQYRQQVEHMANWLMSVGLKAGDRVALLCDTRYEWVIADMAMHHAALVNVPIYPTLAAKQAAYILQDSGAKAVIVSGRKQLDKVLTIVDECPELGEILMIDADALPESGRTVHRWTDALAKGATLEGEMGAQRAERIAQADPDAMCSIIYTSGTTGNPKGVILSHSNFMSNAKAIVPIAGLSPEDTLLSFLPLSHVLGRMVYYALTYAGGTIAYAESIDSIGQNLGEVRPTLMAAVPRLLEKVYGKIMDSVQSGSALKRKLFTWALAVGHRHRLAGKPDPLQYAIADKLVFSKIRQRLGGRMRMIVCGGAPMRKDIGEFFYSAGIPVCEGYGLTETSPVITFNSPENIKFGTVGQKIPDVDVFIAEDGEICVKGPNVMAGYYQLPEANAEVFDADGWFHTGDIGEIDGDGFLRITDRKKELIVLSNGKKVAPQPIENLLKSSPYIEQVMVVGEAKKYCTCLLVPNMEKLQAFAQEQGIAGKPADLLGHQKVLDLYRAELDRLSKDLAQFEKLKKFSLLDREWTVETGELTPTMKCKRKIILANYASQVDGMYAEGELAPV